MDIDDMTTMEELRGYIRFLYGQYMEEKEQNRQQQSKPSGLRPCKGRTPYSTVARRERSTRLFITPS